MITATGKKRIEYIDALRAFALFGVIMVHVNQMYSFYNELNDFSYFSAIGYQCRKVVFWLFDDKSRTIFSTLFGISFYLILNNPTYTNRKFLWRCVLLMCFGLFDKFFSSGDILFWYGLNGIILSLIPVRKLSPRHLLLIATALFLLSLINLSPYLETSFPIRYPADTTIVQIMSYPMTDIVVSDLLGRLCIDSTMTLSCFVFGFYLGKSGIIDNITRYTSIRICLLTAILFAVSLVAFRLSGYHPIVWRLSVVSGAAALSLNFIKFFNYFPKMLTPMMCYGRLGLTNYSSQYIIGTVMVLYISIPQKMSIEYVFVMGIAIYLLQTAFAWFWTSHYRYGPLEWLWRLATNLKYEPLRVENRNQTEGQKIAILTSGILPVPAVQGGAVENLIDFYLEYNDQHRLYDITVYSTEHPSALQHKALQSTVNHYHFVDTNSLIARIRRRIRGWMKPRGDYYNYFIEYFFEQACKDLRRQHYNCIILENRPGYAKKLSERGFNNIVLHLHNDLLNNTTPHHRQIFNSLNCILTVSDYIRSRVSTIRTSEKIVTIHNGINLSRFSREVPASVCRTDIGFSTFDFVVVFSGRINKEKGISELIDAIFLLQDLPNIKLLIIGSTFFGNAANEDDFVQRLKKKALAIESRLIFTGFIPYDKMPDYLHLADVAVIPSVWDDPFPTTVLEAQAMGLPIICSNRGGIPEEVGTENAIIVHTEHQYVEALADAIRQLYYSPQRRAKMAEASLRHAAYFDKERFARDFFNALAPYPEI